MTSPGHRAARAAGITWSDVDIETDADREAARRDVERGRRADANSDGMTRRDYQRRRRT